MKLLVNFNKYLFAPRWHFSRFQFNLVALFFLSIGLVFGTLFTLKGIVSIFAASSPWTQTDWSGGVGSSTANQYISASSVDTTGTAGQISLTITSGWASDLLLWTRRLPITVTNSNNALANYQIKLNVAYDVEMKADFGDLRFTNSTGTPLSYWVQTQINNTSAVVWVKTDSLAESGDTLLYMYYGNSTATTTSSGSNTFDFFDDFDDGTIDPAKWIQADAGDKITEGNGKLRLIYGSGAGNWDRAIYAIPSFTRNNWSLEFDMRWTSDYSPYDAMMWGWKDDGTGISYTNLIYGHYNQGNGSCTTNCASPNYESGSGVGTNSWNNNTDYLIRDRMRSSGGHYYEKSTDNGANFTTTYTSTYSTATNLHPAFMLYSGDYLIDNLRVRKWLASEPTSIFGSESILLPSSGTLTSNIFDAGFSADWGNLTYTTSGSGTVTVKVRTSNSATMEGATNWAACAAKTSGADLTGGCVTDTQRYVQYQVTLEPQGANTPTFSDISIAFSASDQTRPPTNATVVSIIGINDGDWTNTEPTITWTDGADNDGGGGLAGYCVALDEVTITGSETSSSLDPISSSGKLSGIDDGVNNNSTCEYIATGTSLNLSAVPGLTLTTGKRYYFSIKAVDVAGNVYTDASETYQDLVSFKFDSTPPTNVSYITAPTGNFSNVTDMFFTWPTVGGGVATDSASQVLGWQYQINSSDGLWQGTTYHPGLNLDYIPATASAYYLVNSRDQNPIIEGSGINIIYLRTVDNAGNPSTSSTYRTASLSYGGAAPSFGYSCDATSTITITPSSSDTNSFSLSWPEATSSSNTITNYYYMINTSAPSSYNTLHDNVSTYIDNGLSREVSTRSLPNVNRGANYVYVVAIDDDDPPNYSSSNCIKGVFNLNSTDPDPVGNLVGSDSSIKSSEQWNVTLTWTAPAYQGAGNLTYIIYRSTDNINFTQVGTSTGLSYVDNTPESAPYYYKVYTKDGANALSPATNPVSITPTGKWTTAPTLDAQPSVSSITTKKATITWGTSRPSDSKIQFGTTSNEYGTVEPSSSTQVSSHTMDLSGLNPGTTYYYRAKWTDEDGNTGISEEKNFVTSAAPNIKEAKATSIGLTSAIIQFTSTNASSAKIYFGKSTSFGGISTTSTGTSESTYNVLLGGLDDGTKYYYKINTFDSDGSEYEGNVYSFETLPRPKVTNVRVQQVANTAQSTLLISWTTNTEVSSIVTYYPNGRMADVRDEVNVALTKGEHQTILRGLLPQTDYILIVKGRDKAGNEAVSDSQRVTTATDTRPPQVTDLHVEGTNVKNSSSSTSQESTAQLLVSWNTDEPATSQVEFGEGTGTTYSQKTQEDANLTLNHLVIISGLSPSKVYHLRALSKDKVENSGNSIDTVTITPKATESAFNLVITNLQQAFGFLGGLNGINN